MKRSIFFSKQLNDYVVDELCKCNHLKSEHGSKVRMIDNSMLRESSEGSCCSGSCVCKQFKFERFVTVSEAARIAVSKRLVSII